MTPEQNLFLSKTVLQENGCRIWIGAKNADGYGYLRRLGKTWKAHRVSYTIFVGAIPPGKHVCHKCDMPSCVEPSHFFLGDNSDNMRDMVKKGRAKNLIRSDQSHFPDGHPPRGEDGGGAKLTAAQAIEILDLKCSGIRTGILAAKYGVDRTTIQRLVRGQNWKSLAGRAALRSREGE